MTDIWKLASTENLTSAQEEFITWYWRRWMPVIADKLYWGEPTRYHKLPVDTCKIARKDENEEEVLEDKVLVTVTSEAFGWLVYANCREKWLRYFEYKKQHGKNAEIPKTGDAAIPFKGKFTDSKLGQVKYGGWSDEGYSYFEQYKTELKTFRRMDKAADYATMKKVLNLVRTEMGITGDGTKKRKRKSKGGRDAPAQKKAAITIEDE